MKHHKVQRTEHSCARFPETVSYCTKPNGLRNVKLSCMKHMKVACFVESKFPFRSHSIRVSTHTSALPPLYLDSLNVTFSPKYLGEHTGHWAWGSRMKGRGDKGCHVHAISFASSMLFPLRLSNLALNRKFHQITHWQDCHCWVCQVD